MNLKPLYPKPLSSNNPFLYSILINHFSTYSPSSHSHSPSSIRARDEESKNVRVVVWWDFENCGIPPSVNVFRIAQSINTAVRANGIKGPVQITAFGDVFQLSRASQVALSATGVNMNHIPNGGKNSADRSLLVDLMYWVSQNPPPAHLFLISGDRDFANILHRLRMNNYNVLLASRGDVPTVLCSAASIMWNWSDLVRGENLNGRRFNQPPDGPHGSWYGHFRVPLEDPFSVDEQPLQTEEVHEENSEISTFSDTKIRPVPAAVLKQVRQILTLHPKGIAITELRSELTKSNVSIPKDLYGHKKFLRFLMSMHEILKLRNTGDGQFIVCGINTKAPEPIDANRCTSSNNANAVADNGNPQISESSNLKVKDLHVSRSDGETSASHPSADKYVEKHPNDAHNPFSPVEKVVEVECTKDVRQPPGTDVEVSDLVDSQVAEPHMLPLKEHTSGSEVGIIRSFWRKWFSGGQQSEMKIHDTSEKAFASRYDSDQKSKESLEIHVSSSGTSMSKETKNGIVESRGQEDCPAYPVSCTSTCGASVEENKIEKSFKPNGENFSKRPGLFNRIRNWHRYWSNPKPSAIGEQSLEEHEQRKLEEHEQQKQDVFSEDSFWKDVGNFISTPMGSLIILQSRTRKQMAQKLQSRGPSSVRSLNEKETLKLVDLLISQKKWVEESPTKVLPFKPAHSMSTSPADPHFVSVLSSIFLNTSESTLKNAEKRIQNVSDTVVVAPVRQRRPTEKSRSAILVDCQQLLIEILDEFPDGYNMGGFRKLFLEKYGYPLDVQQLGYKKLASLLQIMPGVKIESTLIIPSSKASESSSSYVSRKLPNSDGKLCDPSAKDDESDSMWEELGPVTAGRKQPMKETHYEYESSISDDYFSDSGENSDLNAPVVQAKTVMDDQDSSLLQILGSWYSKDAEDRTTNLVGKDDYTSNGMTTCDLSGLGTKTANSPRMHNSQLSRSQKRFSFVADPVAEHNQKLVDGILGSLKSNESRMRA